MATINGPFDVKSSFGNMRCYYDPGTKKWIYGKKGGFGKNQFNTLSKLKPQREVEIGGRHHLVHFGIRIVYEYR